MRLLPRRRPQGKARRNLPDLSRDEHLQGLEVRSPAPARVLRGRAPAGVACEKCHLPEPGAAPAARPAKGAAPPVVTRQYKDVSFKCATCHKDPHLGQVSTDCATCHGTRGEGLQGRPLRPHALEVPAHGQARDDRPARSATRKETGTFPAGKGTAVRLTGISTECRTCHKDPHLGQLSTRCETCHDTSSFKIAKYTHPAKKETLDFFVGKHAKIACAECHQKETFNYPAGRGTTVRYAVPVDCAHCHEDPHRGTLGRDCASCHSADALANRLARLPQEGPLPARGQAPDDPLRVLPPQRRPQGHADGLLRLPLDPQARRPLQDEARHGLRHLPPADRLDGRHVDSRGRDELPARDAAQDDRLRVLPQGPGVQRHAARLLLLPPRGLRARQRPEPRRRRLPDGLRGLPQAHLADLAGRHLRPLDLPARSASTRRRRAPRATRTTSSRARLATATPATGRTTRTPRTRRTPRPCSRRPARAATNTRPRTGRTPGSTTTWRRPSPSAAPT